MNEFLKSIEKRFDTSGLRMDFCKNEVEQSVTAIVIDTEIFEILEAADCSKIGLYFLFIGKIEKVCCSDTRNALVTEIFTFYVEVVNKMLMK